MNRLKNSIIVTSTVIIGVVLLLALFLRVDVIEKEQAWNEMNELYYERNESSARSYNDMVERYDSVREERNELLDLVQEEGWDSGYTITHYSANDPAQGTNNIVATGFNLDYENVGNLPIAAANCFPLYSIIWVFDMGTYIILDNGVGYLNEDGQYCDDKWVDILVDSKQEALSRGTHEDMWVKLLRRGGE